NADKAAKSAHADSGAASGKKRTSQKKVGRAAARHIDLARHLAELPPVSGHGVVSSRQAVHPTHAIRPQGSHRVLPRAERSTVKQRKRAPKGFKKSSVYRLGAMSPSDPAPKTSSFLGFMTTAGVDTASISGTLSDTSSGLPVAGACVESFGYLGGDDYVDGPIACSDASGQYQLTGLAEGDYDLHVTDHVTGHIETWVDSVHVAAGQAVSGINIEMDQGGTIAGAVTDTGGQPLVGVCATVYDEDEDGYDGGCTDATGRYQSVGLPDGSYKVVFEDRDGQHVRQWFDDAAHAADATPVQVSAGQVTDHIDASMTLGGSISGTVSGAGSAALEGICVSFESADAYESACTDASGHYRSPGLPTGSYTVHFEDYQNVYRDEYYDDVLSVGAATPVSVTLGDETPGIDAVLARYGQISGVVTAATTGAPLADVCVVAFDQSGEDVEYDYTALDGTYTLGGLSDGSYRVMFGCGFGDWIEQWYDGAASGADSTPVATTLDHVTGGVDAALEPYGSISGTVTGADTGTGVADICVLVEST
ncbi:MAG TPA: carboxypeptidase-like regulatory domain-containing protein, partial [Marmoricola sp.]